ncbi:MAG: hypothetical protein J1F10_06655 [Muribaculaceae bacterium]|nr:hypothetical protein [Muribaculaceae bacterium]
MKNPIMFLLFALVVLFSCQYHGQQGDKNDVLPIDSASVVSDSSNMEAISPDTANIDYTTLPDSAKITLFHPFYLIYVDFSIYHNKQSFIVSTDFPVVGTLSKEYSFEILKKLGAIFIDHKTPVIISKKKLPYHVASDFPHIKFEIYYNGKIIRNDYWVAEECGEYEYTYSDSFLEFFDQLESTAIKFCEPHTPEIRILLEKQRL